MEYVLTLSTKNYHFEVLEIIEENRFDDWGSIPYVEEISRGEYYIVADSYDVVTIFTDLVDDLGLNYKLSRA